VVLIVQIVGAALAYGIALFVRPPAVGVAASSPVLGKMPASPLKEPELPV
jgi:hypothetical protein